MEETQDIKTLIQKIYHSPDFLDIFDEKKMAKEPAPRATFHDDPLALSCASYRLFKENPARRFVNIDTLTAADEDRVHAQSIRKYYGALYMMKALSGVPLTKFQQKASQFLAGLHHLTTEETGLLYKLPYFYEEDITLDRIVEQTVSGSNRRVESKILELTPLEQVFQSRKGAEVIQFYYRDQHNVAAVVQVRTQDPLLPMIRGLFKQPQIRVQTHLLPTYIRGGKKHLVNKLANWELVF